MNDSQYDDGKPFGQVCDASAAQSACEQAAQKPISVVYEPKTCAPALPVDAAGGALAPV